MHQKAESLGVFGRTTTGHRHIALGSELRHSIGDCIVQAAVQGFELFDAERRVPLYSKASDGLAQITVVMNDLIHHVSELQQLLSVRGGSHADFRQGTSVVS